jgi:hypothetical protein
MLTVLQIAEGRDLTTKLNTKHINIFKNYNYDR